MLDTTTELEAALADVAGQVGLQVAADVGDAELAAAPGPFTTSILSDGPGGDPRACVAVRDTFSPDDSAVAATLATALTKALGGGLQATPSDPVADAGELLGRFPTPTTAVGLTDGEALRALVVVAVDRRGPASAGGGASAAAAGAALGAATGAPSRPAGSPGGLDKLVNVSLDVSVELGRTQVSLADVMHYDVGTVVELDRAAGAPVDIRVNGVLLAHGEVVIIDDEYAVRVTEVFDPEGGR